jgi:hypothetical protein
LAASEEGLTSMNDDDDNDDDDDDDDLFCFYKVILE